MAHANSATHSYTAELILALERAADTFKDFESVARAEGKPFLEMSARIAGVDAREVIARADTSPTSGTQNAAPQVSPAQDSRESDGKGSAMPAVAAPVGPWKECVYKHPDAPPVLTNREEGYLDRIRERLDILLARTNAKYRTGQVIDWERELHAMEWALSRLGATTSPIEKEKPCS